MKALLQKPWVQKLCWIALLALLWQGLHWGGIVPELLLPGLPAIFAALWHSLTAGQLAMQVLYSLGVVLAGILIAMLSALMLAALSLSSRVFGSLADTLCMLAHPLPAVALLPLIIIWFGVGTQAIIIIIVHSVLWPLLVNMNSGFKSVRQVYIATGKSLGLNAARLFFYVYLPASAAQIIAGLKIGWARAWRALISAEMIFGASGGSGGIGWYMFKSRVMMDTPGLFAGIIVVVLIGVVMDALLAWMEGKTLLRWGA